MSTFFKNSFYKQTVAITRHVYQEIKFCFWLDSLQINVKNEAVSKVESD